MKFTKSLDSLIEKASNTTAEGITITDNSQDENPLIYVNDGFERLTGYSREEVIGKNCRFLQGKDTDQQTLDVIRKSIKRGEECVVELLNYRKDGTPFWNRLSITPLFDKKKNLTHFVGIQSDITELKEIKEKLEKSNKELKLYKANMIKELEHAREAQQFILPQKLPKFKNIKFASRFVPMKQIGGDFYDVVEIEKGIFGILVADVTGHGIPASLLTFMASNTFKTLAINESSTKAVMSLTNKMLYKKMPNGSFVSMFYAIFDTKSNELKYTQAGHPHGLVMRNKTKEIIPLSTEGFLLGVFEEDFLKFEEKSLALMPGDKVVLYSDAIIEAANPQQDMLGIGGLVDFLRSKMKKDIDTIFDDIYDYGKSFSQKGSYSDDFTLIGFEIMDS